MKKNIQLLFNLEFSLKFIATKQFYNSFIVLLLFFYCITNPVLAKKNANTPKLITIRNENPEIKNKDVDLGYKRISVEAYNLLVQQNEEAKKVYEKMSSHPKIITKNKGESEQFAIILRQYKIINLSYIGKDIRFNSLFIKTIVENPKIHYLNISPTEAFLYTDIDLDLVALSMQLNDISLTPIMVIEQKELKSK